MVQDFFIKSYSRTADRNITGIISFLYKAYRFVLRVLAQCILPVVFHFKKRKYVVTGGDKIIVSLTSFPARINKLWLVLESLLRQEVKADRIIVWLSKDQFSNFGELPTKLQSYQERGVLFRFEQGDLRSYKKFYYAFSEFSDSCVITVDDDILYDSSMIKELVESYMKAQGKRVIARFGTIVTKNSAGQLEKYVNWSPIVNVLQKEDYFFGSGGGTLFKPSDLYKDVCNKELFLTLCPLADDVWLNAMCRLGEVEIIMCNNIAVFPVNSKNNISLSAQNVYEDFNDKQIELVNEYYRKELNKIVF